MISNNLRVGNFTSSEISALLTKGKDGGFGAPAKKYIKQTNNERRLGRSVDKEANARPLAWGNLLERYIFTLLPLEYTLISKETIQHPKIDCFVGSPDGQKFDEGGTVTDSKCPHTLESFCDLVDGLYEKSLTGMEAMNYLREEHKQGETYYQQLVSNAILTNSKYAELIVFAPYFSELQAIRDLASMIDDPIEQRKYYWIAQASDDELPYLPDGGYYKNLNIIRFEVPTADKKALISAVYKAKELLIEWPTK